MANVTDVAEYILASTGPISAMKLQKLAYYAKAWHAVWSDAELYPQRIEAWANGPVSPTLYAKHRGHFTVYPNQFGGNPKNLSADEADTIDRVLTAYGNKSSQWLSDLTHMEAPWLQARKGVPAGERSEQEITLASMVEYYGSL